MSKFTNDSDRYPKLTAAQVEAIAAAALDWYYGRIDSENLEREIANARRASQKPEARR